MQAKIKVCFEGEECAKGKSGQMRGKDKGREGM